MKTVISTSTGETWYTNLDTGKTGEEMCLYIPTIMTILLTREEHTLVLIIITMFLCHTSTMDLVMA
ncbi:hypothetical protein BRD20_03230 [Halobacteriales archaeon SW_8_65_20]|nr:MAG: hypothetical protein BRD20_03230 [Halobacteriales archaeon SW_8_65_20]